jgi:uncharacterized protein (DUF1330 family)
MRKTAVAVEFPSIEQAVRRRRSAGHQQAAAFRRARGVAEVEEVIVKSGDATPV